MTRLVALFATVLAALVSPAPADAADPTTCRGLRVTMMGTADDDVIRGTPGRDVIHGRAGSDVINGLQGDDVICGGYGADQLRGQAGRDRLYGDRDALTWNGAETWTRTGDTLHGGPGDDTLVPGADTRHSFPDTYYDTIAYDTSRGPVLVDLTAGVATGDGTDRLAVNSPVRLIGSSGNDRLVGSPHYDEVYGKDGDDVLVDLLPNDPDWFLGGPGEDCMERSAGDPVSHDTMERVAISPETCG